MPIQDDGFPDPACRVPEDQPAARLLVVDDEPSVVDLFRDFLTAQGYDVVVAESGEEAILLLAEGGFEVVLTDINLPGLSGLEVMRRAREVDSEAAVIVVTGHASAASAIDALRQGAYDYITKPFDLEEVHQIVERAIANRRLKAINRQLLEELRQKNHILSQHEQVLRERVELATKQLTRLYQVGKEIGANLDLLPRLSVIASKAVDLLGARASVIYLKNEESNEFRPASGSGLELPGRDEAGAIEINGLVGQAIASQRAVRHGSDGAAARPVPGVPGRTFDQVLAVPMVAEEKVIGVLALFDKPEGFTDDDESFLALFASQSAVAVRNSQLFDHTKSLDRLKSDFVAVVSHEIRTPLTSVKGAVELLSDDRYFKNNEQQNKLLTIAHANTERLLLLINDILDFSKLEAASLPLNLERQRLEPVLHMAAANMRTQLEERHLQLQVVLAADLPDLMIDPNRIGQVLINLLSNAIKFSPRGGRIELTAERWKDLVRVGVQDHGEGIQEKDLPKLFRKFSQIDSSATRKAGGTGLGLVICKGIVEQHGGTMWVESAEGQGSSFYFTLPAADRLEASQAAMRAA
jgi:signal transduction histidine kinase/DNA-binding response OmpR family regulator